jgi:hypothetical protein
VGKSAQRTIGRDRGKRNKRRMEGKKDRTGRGEKQKSEIKNGKKTELTRLSQAINIIT